MITFMKQNSLISDSTISLDNEYTNLDEDSENNFIDVLVKQEPDTQNLDNYFITKQIQRLKESLTVREYDVMCYLFGVDGYDELTLQELSKKLNYSAETIRMIKEQALNKIRSKYSKNDF
jgi:DNA-directed RNA polymerase sigma subunit (sigma70/sigma32)